MKTKTIYLLIAAVVIALAVSFGLRQWQRPLSENADNARPLLPELQGHVNDVSGVTLIGAGGKVIATLKRGADGWTVAEKSNYPADFGRIREMLLKLEQAKLIEPKTADPGRYAEIGVNDAKDKATKGVLVELAGLAQPTRIIIGVYNGAAGGGTFVRRDGDPQTWLATDNLTVPSNEVVWQKHEISDIAPALIRSATFTSPDGKVIRIYKDKPSEGVFKLADVPKGREEGSAFSINTPGAVLSGFRSQDAMPASAAPPPDKAAKAEFTRFDGLIVNIVSWQNDGTSYAQLKAHLDTAAAQAHIDADQATAKSDYEAAVKAGVAKTEDDKSAPGAKPTNGKIKGGVEKPLAVSDPAKDRQDKLDRLNQEVATLNKTFDGWTFTIPVTKYNNLNMKMEDMLKPLNVKTPSLVVRTPDGKESVVKPANK